MSRRGWVLFALMSVIWGMPYLFIKVADGGVSVPVLVFTRLAVAAALLLPLAIRRRQIAGLWRHWRWLLLFATVEMLIPWALLSDAERHLSSSMTGLLIASVPIIGVVLARLTGGTERLTVVESLLTPGVTRHRNVCQSRSSRKEGGSQHVAVPNSLQPGVKIALATAHFHGFGVTLARAMDHC